ncbi:hypothetical protein [Hallella multisaccharivorax]|uniref:hypothetical protein n=1 Tax=Hallella multisaccharivorax TaxID=310514 RepID=UPI0036158662
MTKTETPLKEVPQSIGYVTKELVLDQGATVPVLLTGNVTTLWSGCDQSVVMQ